MVRDTKMSPYLRNHVSRSRKPIIHIEGKVTMEAMAIDVPMLRDAAGLLSIDA